MKNIFLITIIIFFTILNISNVKSETLEVSDIILDIKILKGKSVKVKGFYMSLGELGFMYEELGSMTSLSVEPKNADRNTRKYLLKKCASGCNITIKGTLSEVYGMITLNLESIVK